MIFEFAIEPKLVVSWCDPVEFRYFKGKFGIGERRIGCFYPKSRWRQLVVEEFQKKYHGCDQDIRQHARKRLDVILSHIRNGVTFRHKNWVDSDGWLDCAQREHRGRPIHGILITKTEISSKNLLFAKEISDGIDKNEIWNPENQISPRIPEKIVKILMPLLHCCSEIKFVDPYLDMTDNETKWTKVIVGCLRELAYKRDVDEYAKVEIHTCVDREFKDKTGFVEKSEKCDVARRIFSNCKEKILENQDLSGSVKFFVWSEKTAGYGNERFHNRYVLTNVGGVIFPHGLDAPGSGHDDLTVLSRANYDLRWPIYNENSNEFDRILCEDFLLG